MKSNISGTDRLVDFLRQNMLAKFCVQWPSFSKLVDRFGEQEILLTYAEKLAGRGYKTGQIKSAIDKCTQNDTYYPKPYVFANMVKSPNFKVPENENKKLTADEKYNVSRILDEARNNQLAQKMHSELGMKFRNKDHYRSQIERVAEQLLGRPLTK